MPELPPKDVWEPDDQSWGAHGQQQVQLIELLRQCLVHCKSGYLYVIFQAVASVLGQVNGHLVPRSVFLDPVRPEALCLQRWQGLKLRALSLLGKCSTT
jgi:hypothetical protein